MGKEKKKMMVRVMRKREEEERKGMCMYPYILHHAQTSKGRYSRWTTSTGQSQPERNQI
jgi:hypothetical protein